MLKDLLATLIGFFQANFIKMIIGLVIIAVFYFAYYVSTSSIKKLKTQILPFYPFDLFYTHGEAWSLGYFIIIILTLGILIFLLLKGNFYAGPA